MVVEKLTNFYPLTLYTAVYCPTPPITIILEWGHFSVSKIHNETDNMSPQYLTVNYTCNMI